MRNTKTILAASTALSLLAGAVFAGSGNEALLSQSGNANNALVTQSGDNNSAFGSVDGGTTKADMIQSGDQNTLTITQSGDGNEIGIKGSLVTFGSGACGAMTFLKC